MMWVRPISIVTQTSGAAINAAGPCAATKRRTSSAKIAT
jgi:hypothetical protein